MQKVSSAFAQTIEKNKWSYHTVTNTNETRSFSQQEILYSDTNPQIHNWILEAVHKSGDGMDNSIEIGFFVVEKRNGELVREFTTSHDRDAIYTQDLNRAYDQLFKNVTPEEIARIQFYHTHPCGPMSLTISRADVDEAIRLQERGKEKGANVPFDMHAMPYDISFKGHYKQFQRPKLGTRVAPPPILIPVEPTLLRINIDI
tara:strand:+ start:954 stop:1559 length:606 start_codon:yes stop_codon:yes gene_type:complete